MERVIKFEYIFDTGKKIVLTLDEIQSGKLLDYFLNGFGNVLHRRIFTGLTDKNGKDIYEGDVLNVCNGSINTVLWMENPYDVKYVVNKGFTLPMFCWDRQGKSIMDKTHWCEVVGNTYENPELLSTDKTKTVE